MWKRAVLVIILLMITQSILSSTTGLGIGDLSDDDSFTIGDTYDLQSEIDGTPEGGTLYLPSGEISGTFYINRSMNLVGQGNLSTIISSPGVGIYVKSSDVNISGIGFRARSYCVYIRGTHDNIGISECNFSNSNHGIYVYDLSYISRNLLIRNNSFFNIVNYGLYLGGFSRGRIENNLMTSIGTGLSINYLKDVNISGNHFRRGYRGLYSRNSERINVTGNSILYQEIGMDLEYSNHMNISGNVISDCELGIEINRISKCDIGMNTIRDGGVGIYLFYSEDNRIHNCTIEDFPGNGIEFYSSNSNTIENCTISDCGWEFDDTVRGGINVDYSSTYTMILDNDLFSCGVALNPFRSLFGGTEIRGNEVNGRKLVFLRDESDINIADEAGQVILDECMNITIRGHNLSDSSLGILTRETDELTVSNNQINGNYYGILMRNDDNYNEINDIRITDNIIRGADLYCAYITSRYWVRDVNISGNVMQGETNGIYINGASSSSSYSVRNEFNGNSFSGFSGYGLYTSTLKEAEMVNNRFTDCNESLYSYGYYQDDSYSFNVSGNSVEGGSVGIRLSSINGLTMRSNNVFNTTESAIRLGGIWDATVTSNKVQVREGTGIYLSGSSCNDVQLKDNEIKGAPIYGIHLWGASDIEFVENEFTGCGMFIDPDGGGDWTRLDIDATNKVNGKQIFFFSSKPYVAIPDDPGQIMIKDWDNLVLKDLDIDNTSVAVELVNCDLYTVDNCSFRDNYIGTFIDSSYDEWRGGKITSTDIARCRYDGISAYESKLLVENCTITDCGYPFYSEGRSGLYSIDEDIYLRETDFIGCGVFFDLRSLTYVGDTLNPTNTTVNGKELTVFLDVDDIEISEPAGQIYLIDCQDVSISDQNLSRSTLGIFSLSSWNIAMDNVSADDCIYGMEMECMDGEPAGFNVEGGSFSRCREDGIRIITGDSNSLNDVGFFNVRCDDNGRGGIRASRIWKGFSLENSSLSGNGENGLDLIQVSGYEHVVMISNNTLNGNSGSGLHLDIDTRGTIFGNSFNGNGRNGIEIQESRSQMDLKGNDMSRNGMSGLKLLNALRDYLVDNCTISENGESGLYLEGRNLVLRSNDIIDNGGWGIWLRSNYCELSWNNLSFNREGGLNIIGSNNEVQNNSIFRNRDYGVVLGPNLRNNFLFNNYFVSNTGQLGQVFDETYDNFWDNGHAGNFWDDHQSPDTDGNGIVDIPRRIPGPEIFDRFPQVMVNHDPIFVTDPSTEGMSHVAYFQIIEVFDRDPVDRIVVEVETAPVFLEWNGQLNAVAGTPLTEHIGSHVVNLSVTDGKGGISYLEYTINISNNPVRLLDNPLPDINEGDELLHIIPVINLDDDDLAWSIETSADFLRIGVSDGILRGVPDDADLGRNWVNIGVDDGRGAVDHVNYSFQVFNVNDAPLIETVDITTAYEDEMYRVDYRYLDPDPDGDEALWHLTTDADFLVLSELSGSVHGTPKEEDIGTYSVNISVRDVHGEIDFHRFTLEVLNVNDAPRIMTDQPLDTIDQGQEYHFDFEATDSDPTNDVITWSIETDASFLEMDPDTGILTGTPGNDDVGGWEVKVTVVDPYGENDTLRFGLWVNDVNDPPVFTIEELPDATEDETYSVNITAVDIDHPPDILLFEILSGPSFLTIDAETGILSGIPRERDVGVARLNISVRDEGGLSVSREFSIEVLNVNDAPTPEGVVIPFSIKEDSDGSYIETEGLFIDIDGDLLSFSADTDNPHLEVTVLENGTMMLVPESDWNGVAEINLTASDGEFSATLTLSIKVMSENDAPVITDVDFKDSYGPDEDQICSVSAEDPDLIYGDELIYSWFDEDSVRIATGAYVVLDLPAGKHRITVVVSDIDGQEAVMEMEFEVEKENGTSSILIMILVVLFILAIISTGMIFLFSRRRKKETEEKNLENDFFLPKQPPTTLETQVQSITPENGTSRLSEGSSGGADKQALKPAPVRTSFEPNVKEDGPGEDPNDPSEGSSEGSGADEDVDEGSISLDGSDTDTATQ